MSDVDVDQIGEKEAQKGNAGQLAVHVHVAHLPLVVVGVEHDVRQAVKERHVAFGHVLRPGLLEPVDRLCLERHYDRHEGVEGVELVEAFGDLDEDCDHFAARLDALAGEDLLLAPEGGLVEAARELDDVGRLGQLLAGHPLAADELVGLDLFEEGQVDECELTLGETKAKKGHD